MSAAESIRCVFHMEPLWKTVLGPALVLISVFVAWLGIRNARSVARQKATLDIIEKFESTEHYRSLNEGFSAIRRADDFACLHNPCNDADRAARGRVQDYLNHYELVAIGIRNNILDAKIYGEWMGSAVVRDWNAAAAYIQRERWRLNDAKDDFVYRPRLYANYQWLAARFSRTALRLTIASSAKPSLAEAGGPGDDPLPEPIPPDRQESVAPASAEESPSPAAHRTRIEAVRRKIRNAAAGARRRFRGA